MRFRPATHLVVLVNGTRAHAHGVQGEIETALGRVGLRLNPAKTRIVTIDEGFDFLGFRIRRHRQRGSDRHLIYTYPSTTSLTSIKRKIKQVTARITHQSADRLLRQLGSMVRGWAQYFRHSSASKTYGHLQHYLWWRVWIWLNNKHPKSTARWIIRRYYDGWVPEFNGTRLYQPSTMTIKRYRYRGSKIPTPWGEPQPA